MMEEINKIIGRRKRKKVGGEDGIGNEVWIYATENLRKMDTSGGRVFN